MSSHSDSHQNDSESSDHVIRLDQQTQQAPYKPLYGDKHIMDLNLNDIPGDRPWRECKTREEIAQYFNYGFDEITFRLYQKLAKRQQNRK